MSLVFYYAPQISMPQVHWALEELGVHYEKVKLDLHAGDQKKPEFMAMNPNGKVPLLVEDGLPIFESLAILLHLGEKYGVDKGLFPAVGRQHIETLKWMAWAYVTVWETFSRIIRNSSERFPEELRNAKASEAAKQELFGLWQIVDRALEGKDYLVGDHFTLADLAVSGFVRATRRYGVDISSLRNVQRWSGPAMSRPAIGRVLPFYDA